MFNKNVITKIMKRNFNFKGIFHNAFNKYKNQHVVSYNFSILKTIINKSCLDSSFFSESCSTSYCEYGYIPSLERYKDVPNSAGDLAQDMMRGLMHF